MEYYSAIKKNTFESVLMRWMKLEPIIQSEVSQKEKHQYSVLTEAEDIKKRWQEYTEELYKKDLHHPNNYNGMVTHLKPDILKYEVKWTLESITTNKASGGDGILTEQFKILKDNAVQVFRSIYQ